MLVLSKDSQEPAGISSVPEMDNQGCIIMSLKRILGTMLATRLGGRGRRRRGFGTSSMLGGLGSRKMGGKLGLAALGYMAYQAYQGHQSRSGATGSAGASSGTSRSGIGGMIQDVADFVSGSGKSDDSRSTEATRGETTPELVEDERAAAEFSDEKALLLIRAMVTAAYSDGALSQEERTRIMQEIDDADADPEDRQIMEREIADPKPLDDLLMQVNDQETAQEFYLASRAAIDGESALHQEYLSTLRQRLGLSEGEVQQAEELAT